MPDMDPGERLEKHRTLVAWLEYQLTQERKKVRELEQQASEWERRREVAHRERRFTIERTWSDEQPDRLHRGGCTRNPDPARHLEAAEAAQQVRELSLVPCDLCNPIAGLRDVPTPTVDNSDGS